MEKVNDVGQSKMCMLSVGVALLLLLTAFANIYGQLHPGVRLIHSGFTAGGANGSQKLGVDHVWQVSQSDYASLPVGTTVTHIEVDDNIYPIGRFWLKQTLVNIQSDAEFDNFIAAERFLYEASKRQVALVTADGTKQVLTFRKRTLLDTSGYFWLYYLLAFISMMMALWAIKIDHFNKWHGFNVLASIAFSMSCIFAISAKDRLWAIHPDALIVSFYLGNLSMRAYAVFYLYILWNVPHRIGIGGYLQYVPAYLALLCFVTWFLQVTGIYRNFTLLVVQVIFVVGLLAIAGFFIQWRITKNTPKRRLVNLIALRWLVVTIAMCGAFGFGFNLMWQVGMANGEEADLINLSFAVILKMGVVALLLKQLLYRFESWWWRAWALFGGFSLAMITFLFVAELALGYVRKTIVIAAVVFAVAYVLIGLYFRYRYAKYDAKIMEHASPKLVAIGTTPQKQHANQMWQDIFTETFNPLKVVCINCPKGSCQQLEEHGLVGNTSNSQTNGAQGISMDLAQQLLTDRPVAIAKQGEVLLVRSIYEQAVIVLSGGAQGLRLFTPQDEKRAHLFWQIASQGRRAQEAYMQGEVAERKRIAADLHDDIGGKLLYLASEKSGFGRYAQATLEDLRTLTRGLGGDDKALGELVADINYQLADRSDIVDIDYDSDIRIHQDLTERLVSAHSATMLASILSELHRNAVQHTSVKRITLKLDIAHNQVVMVFTNDGEETDPALWRSGLGTVSIKRRIHSVSGDIAWQARQGGGVVCRATWCLNSWLKQADFQDCI